MARKKPEQFSDEYFTNLTMKYDERDDEIYPKWAVWCYNSNDKYFINGKNGYFYTQVRTDKEIEIERKHRVIDELIFTQNREGISEEDWRTYEEWIRNYTNSEEDLLEFIPITYKEWKNK